MNLSEAIPIAERLKAELAPWCSRIEIAGSIRRERAEVKDIEIVCVLDQSTNEFLKFWYHLVSAHSRRKGQPGGKYMQVRVRPEGIIADIFIAEKGNWGNIFAIRTGSAEYSHKVLAAGWVKAGYKSIDGYLYKIGPAFTPRRKIELHEELDLFNLIGVPYTDPKNR